MSPEVAAFLLELLGRQTLNAGADDFEQVAQLVIQARADLREVIEPPRTEGIPAH